MTRANACFSQYSVDAETLVVQPCSWLPSRTSFSSAPTHWATAALATTAAGSGALEKRAAQVETQAPSISRCCNQLGFVNILCRGSSPQILGSPLSEQAAAMMQSGATNAYRNGHPIISARNHRERLDLPLPLLGRQQCLDH